LLGPDSVKQKLYAYSTSSLQSGNGRFSGGVMSLLLLEAVESQPGQWKVKKFNPSALYHGSFGAATGITSIINSTEFGSILLVNSISLLDADVEDCYAPVEDLYILDGDQLSLIARIPGIRKVCQNQQDPNIHSDVPHWNTQMQIEPQGKNRLSILLEVEGALGVN